MSAGTRRRFTPAVTVIVIFGIVSLLGDMVYESARGANGQYLNLLGVTAAEIGLVLGIGEFLGYVLRLAAGVLSDRSGRHWLFIFVGYGMLVVVPVMGFTLNWNLLVVLILTERIGKSLRNPAKDTILSGVAENQVGIGFAFGLQEALDQIGAFAGPLLFTLVFALTAENGIPEYQTGYRLLLVPFGLLMAFLAWANRRIARDNLVSAAAPREYRCEKLQPVFWIYAAFTFFSTLGFVNFGLVGYHLKARSLVSDADITLLYAGAMAIDAVTALLIGKAYDRMKSRTGVKTGGLVVLLMVPFLTLALPFLVLSGSAALVVVGMALFGVVMGAHETVMRSAIADITPFSKRGTGYGVFNTGYGLAFLAGSATMGWLYDRQLLWVIFAVACAAETIAVLLFIRMNGMARKA